MSVSSLTDRTEYRITVVPHSSHSAAITFVTEKRVSVNPCTLDCFALSSHIDEAADMKVLQKPVVLWREKKGLPIRIESRG